MDLRNEPSGGASWVFAKSTTYTRTETIESQRLNLRSAPLYTLLDDSCVLETVSADEKRRVRRDENLVVPCRQLLEHISEVARLRRMLIQLRFFAPKD